MEQSIQLPSPSKYVLWFAVLFPLGMTVILSTSFLFKVGDKPLTLLGLLTVLALIYAVHLAIFLPVFRRYRLETNHHSLAISIGWYNDTIQWSQIDWASSGPLDGQLQEQKKPRWRTNGIGAPGYKAGWFKLKGGRSAFLAVTDTRLPQLLLVTTNHDIILSAENPSQVWLQLQKHR